MLSGKHALIVVLIVVSVSQLLQSRQLVNMIRRGKMHEITITFESLSTSVKE